MNSRRLNYRKFSPDDIQNYARWYCNDDVMKHIAGRGLTQEEMKARFAQAIAVNQQHPQLGYYAAYHKDNNDFIGITKLVFTTPSQVEVGYGSLPECWGKGYASEMLAAAVTHVQASCSEVTELVAIVNPANTGSKKVLTNRLFEWYDSGMMYGLPVEYYKLKLK